ncbi:polysaccharide deacetylase family protein [Ramlibacter sp.]|uniref:polysaccharide deacetylase family protein n=1 Tax=Ramlibacter sp. TaxID=1917967 RepID=UPI001848D32C|nr:polysaccharide deacetylase family protein [Ramlibacter sp.]MBA2676654.1 polysaccharide deacetylase family protein [Ramlibacter sp.]
MSAQGQGAVPGRLRSIPARWWVLAVAVVLTSVLAGLYAAAPAPPRTLVLLVPDSAALQQPVAQAWIDAAREEGLPLETMTDDAFMRYSGNRDSIAGVILPDIVHKVASELLISQLHSYVKTGGRLMIAYDAAVLDTHTGGYSAGQSRLSRLAGVRYAMYDDLRDLTIGSGPVYGNHDTEKELGMQPGKLDFKYSSVPGMGEMTTYGYVKLQHSYFRTGTRYGARTVMATQQGDVVVGRNQYGDGEVLLVNLPLGYLKTRTDGYMLHRMLWHFAVDVAQLPRLAPVPRGEGGLVLNLHIDSNAAQAPLLQLEQWDWFKTGPFSMHVTAGPDTYEPGDKLGMDLDHNPVMQEFLHRQAALGHEVGNHGGWNHDIFGGLATETNRADYEPWLDANNRSVAQAVGKPVRAYSAPEGNQPVWSTKWLERNGFKAYYFTGDTGLGPTRSYYEGKRPEGSLWAFPVSNYLKIATFEELEDPKRARTFTGDDIGGFLIKLSNYVADQRVARLFYFHPPAAPRYTAVMEGLMGEAKRLAAQGRFRWYTMERLADFMSRREQAQWSVVRESRKLTLRAESTQSMQELSWIFPAAAISAVEVRKGKAEARRQGNEWVVTAGDTRELVVVLR